MMAKSNGKAGVARPELRIANPATNSPPIAPAITDNRNAQCLPSHGRSGPSSRTMIPISRNVLILVKPPKHSPVVDPYVFAAVGYSVKGGAVNSTDNRATVNTVQRTAFHRTQNFISDLTDARDADLVVNGVAETACAGLNNVEDTGPVFVIFELIMFLVER